MKIQTANTVKIRLEIGEIGLAVAASSAGIVPAPPAATQLVPKEEGGIDVKFGRY